MWKGEVVRVDEGPHDERGNAFVCWRVHGANRILFDLAMRRTGAKKAFIREFDSKPDRFLVRFTAYDEKDRNVTMRVISNGARDVTDNARVHG